MLTTRKKKAIMKDHGVHETDTGSASVQIALLTKQIAELTQHLKKHKKDNHSRRGLLKMVGKRRRLLKYLEKTDEKAHKALIKKIDL
ncbi:MAG: 30S ribosomal protein S15 [bacterium]|nr:30S ribosomal protein S15 [bacterium]